MSEVFDGTVEVQDGTGTTTVLLDGSQGAASIGGGGQDGTLHVLDAAGSLRVEIDGTEGAVTIRTAAGIPVVEIRPNGDVGIFRSISGDNREVIRLSASAAELRLGALGSAGDVRILDGSDREVVHVAGSNAALYVGAEGNEGDIVVRDGSGTEVFHVNGAAAAVYVGAEGNEGDIIVRDGAGTDVFHVNGATAAVYVGGAGNEGDVIVRDAEARQVIHANASNAALYVGAAGNEGDVVIRDDAGRETIHLDGGGSNVTVRRQVGHTLRDVLRFTGSNAALYVGATGNEGDVVIRDDGGRDSIHLDGGGSNITVRRQVGRVLRDVLHFNGSNAALYVGAAGNEGDVVIRDNAGRDSIHLDGGGSNITVRRQVGRVLRDVLHFNGSNAAMYVGATGNEGDVIVRDNAGNDVIHLNGASAQVFVGASGNAGDIIVRDDAGRDVFHMDGQNAALYIGASGNEGDLIIRDGGGRDVFHFNAEFAVLDVGASGNEGDIRVRDDAGNVRIHLDGGAGDIRLHGADCAEHFDVRDGETVDAGTVLVIDDDGGLRRSATCYDARVAGVVSGAGGYRPGILLDSFDAAPGRRPVALAGKVFCKVDASYGAVSVGDLLTTSDTPGHAMRVAEPVRAFGAVLGKALAPLPDGRGLLPILVTLQ